MATIHQDVESSILGDTITLFWVRWLDLQGHRQQASFLSRPDAESFARNIVDEAPRRNATSDRRQPTLSQVAQANRRTLEWLAGAVQRR